MPIDLMMVYKGTLPSNSFLNQSITQDFYHSATQCIIYNSCACFLEEIPCVSSGLESCSRLLASFKISMINVANSRALNKANFCLPW